MGGMAITGSQSAARWMRPQPEAYQCPFRIAVVAICFGSVPIVGSISSLMCADTFATMEVLEFDSRFRRGPCEVPSGKLVFLDRESGNGFALDRFEEMLTACADLAHVYGRFPKDRLRIAPISLAAFGEAAIFSTNGSNCPSAISHSGSRFAPASGSGSPRWSSIVMGVL